MSNTVMRQLERFLEVHVGSEMLERLDLMQGTLNERATDDFGFAPQNLKWAMPFCHFLHRYWFRVESHGLENLPAGRTLLVSNHSGQIPIDAMMIVTTILLNSEPPRPVRSMVERWVSTLPYANVLFSRLGQVLGTPENCRHLLEREEAVLVFPEGTRGINKTYDKAYQLQNFGHGFMRLALETKAPIVPIAVVGAEEQYPTVWNARAVAKILGVPALPIAPTMLIPGLGLLPLPVKYRIYFGQPMQFEGDAYEDESDIERKVSEVQDQISSLLQRGLDVRQGFFN